MLNNNFTLDDTQHLCGRSRANSSEEQTADIHYDLKGHFQPIGQGDFILCHGSKCFGLTMQRYEHFRN